MNFTLLAELEAALLLTFLIFFLIYFIRSRRSYRKQIKKIKYDTSNAKDNTLMNFPLPIAVFRLNDSRIIWNNGQFSSMCKLDGSKLDAKLTDLVPEFSGKWLAEGKSVYPGVLTVDGKKYRIYGKLIRPENPDETVAFMGVTYWINVTDFENLRALYEKTRPVISIVVIDNLDEMTRNQPDKVKNDVREAVEDRLDEWARNNKGFVRRYDRDRYIACFEKEALDNLKSEPFKLLTDIHQIENPLGVSASLSMGFGTEASSLTEAIQFADLAVDLALTRGGDQAVIKNKLNYEFFGGRGTEIEKRTKVKSRVMANTLSELIRESSKVLVMGHSYADLDCIGAAAGVCCVARKFGIRAAIVVNEGKNAASPLISFLKQSPEYRDKFISPADAILTADARTLLVIVDTNRPENVDDGDLLDACRKVAVIDHHRVAATYIHNAALGFIEPFASSACELVTEVIDEVSEKGDVLKCEAEALLAGIVLDTKNFTIRTGERTFDAAAFLRRNGADTTVVKKLLQSDMDDTISRYKILQTAELYRNVAIAVPTTPQSRIVAAKAADELLNISGVDASIVIAPAEDGEGIFASARSIGELNVQIIMEKLGGGGNRSAAAVQFASFSLEDAVASVYRAIDDYLG